MSYSDAFPAYRTRAVPDWIDATGRMSEAGFALAFGRATDALFEAIGVDETYRERHQCALYTLESHQRYLREVVEGVELRVDTLIVDGDHKRLHLFHQLRRDSSDELLATSESILVFVDIARERSADFPATIGANIARFRQRWSARPDPEDIGRCIAMRR
jgi:acyl-CoA thioester hydrolase